MKFYWRVNAAGVEPLAEPVQNEVEDGKPWEQAELRSLRLVEGTLPKAVIDAGLSFDEALRGFGEAWSAYAGATQTYFNDGAVFDDKQVMDAAKRAVEERKRAANTVWQTLVEAMHAHRAEIESLYATECPNCATPQNNGELLEGRPSVPDALLPARMHSDIENIHHSAAREIKRSRSRSAVLIFAGVLLLLIGLRMSHFNPQLMKLDVRHSYDCGVRDLRHCVPA